MTARRIAILCLNPWDAPGPFQPFSFAAHRIQASLIADPGVEAEVRVIEGQGTDLDEWQAQVEAFDPDLVGCSAYLWSLPTFVELARRLHRPGRRVVFGGPSARPEVLSLPPWAPAHGLVDALVIREGERAICEIARAGADLSGIAGIALPEPGGGWRRTPERPPIEDLDSLASPFQLGLAPTGVSGHLETFRGCPMSCTFCQWGDLGTRSQVFSAESLAAELRAFQRMDATGVYLVDAGLNLNSRAFRNFAAAEAEVGFLRDTELVCEVYPSLLKDEHLDFLARTDATVGLGLQSMDVELLKRHERPFAVKRFEEVVARLSGVAKTTIEIIMGLPGDTPEGFRRTLDYVLGLPVSVRVYHCLVLPDALLTRAPASYQMDFDPVTLEMRSCLGWTERDLAREVARLDAMVAERNGLYTTLWPMPHRGERVHVPGRPIGTPLWMFPNRDHEDFHRQGGDRR
jgi:hypothetical protein